MNLADLNHQTRKDLKELSDKVQSLEVEQLNLPAIYIPNWPPSVMMGNLALGKKTILAPYTDQHSGLLILKKQKISVSADIQNNGGIYFYLFEIFNFLGFEIGREYGERWIFSNGSQTDRIFFLIIFHQFKKEFFNTVMKRLQHGAGYHNKIVEQVKILFEQFIPGIILERLSSDD